VDFSVAANPLAICLGVSGYVILEEHGRRHLLQVRRAGKLASLEGTMGPSVAGVVDFNQRYRTLQDIIDIAMEAETREELGLRTGEYEVVPLAWALEVYRGGRPQIFTLIKTSLTREDIEQRLSSLDPVGREFDDYYFRSLYGDYLLDRKHFDELNPEACMNYLLMEEYLI
ncbi:MAG: hypothetical protein KKA42_06435, partial [candidate division Zixibacteria bacterium]|nr:hypothetical protein [candidate division Zixibacteria bacterium]